MLRIVYKAGYSIPTKFSLGLQMGTPRSRFVKFMQIQGHKYNFVPTGTQSGQRPINSDCLGEIGTICNYASILFTFSNLLFSIELCAKAERGLH